MSLAELLPLLYARRVRVWIEAGRLRYRAPAGALDQELREALKRHREALLGLLGDPARARAVSVPADCLHITPEMVPLAGLTADEIEQVVEGVPGGAGNVEDVYRLTPIQEGLLFHHRISPDGDAYLLANVSSFDTRARLTAYLEALQWACDRHPVLRTSFYWQGTKAPVQVVHRRARVPVQEHAFDVEEDVAGQLFQRFHPRLYRMDLREAPLLRAHVAFDAAHGRWLLMLLIHHIVSDHTTLDLLQSEIVSKLSGQSAALAPPRIFRTIVAQTLLSDSAEEHETFFRAMLGDIREPTLPYGLSDVRGDGSSVGEARLLLSPGLTRSVRERARKLAVSVGCLCHLAWAEVLARLSQRRQVVFGTVLWGRMRGGEAAERTMGLLINTLPVRVDVGGGSLIERARRTHLLLADLLQHEHAPLALAQSCSGVPVGALLFSSLLNYRNGGAKGAEVAAAEGQAWDGIEDLFSEARTNYPLTMSVDESQDALELVAHVRAPFQPERICGYMRAALEALIDPSRAEPGAPVDVLPVDERQQLLVEWNATGRAYPSEAAVHELIEERVRRAPAAAAVVFEGRTVSYGELNRRANQVARHLRRRGVGAGDVVGLLAERTPETVIGLVGILKAGAAYLPLDPEHPSARLAFMLDDAEVGTVVSGGRGGWNVETAAARVVVDLAAEAAAIDAESGEDLGRMSGPEDPAYVIYTSGSTGQPKGVVLEHRGVCNLATEQIRICGVTESSVVLQFASLGFDASVSEIMMALCAGGRLHLAAREELVEGERLEALCRREGITVATLPPALLATLDPAGFGGVETLIVAGEVCPPAVARRWMVGRRLINGYGPTEATVCASMAVCDERVLPPVIGRPIGNVRLYVVDRELRPAPVGVAGELLVGGVGVGRGYLHRPGLTAEKFIPDPFAADEGGSRLYRTGDLARYLSDGNVEFLGRMDEQVKVRGFRIELGEIESALRGHVEVREAVVLAREDVPGNKRLVAYVVAVGAGVLEVNALCAHLKRSLPEHMVPSAFVFLAALPLTASGKVDRKALPAPDAGTTSGGEYVAPRSPHEEIITRIWQDLLAVERVSVTDNFFALGGHSLLATQAAARLRDALGVEIPLRTLFEIGTVQRSRGTPQHAAGNRAREGPPARARAAATRRAGSLVVCPATPLVPASARACQRRLQYFAGLVGLGRARHGGAPTDLRGDGAPPRSAANDLRRRGGRAPADRSGTSPMAIARRTDARRYARGAGGRGSAPGPGGSGDAIRVGTRTAPANVVAPSDGGEARLDGDDASHRLRRLVDAGLCSRGAAALRGVPARWDVAAGGAVAAIRRLRGLAARRAGRRGAAATSRLLEAEAFGRRRARLADRSAATSDEDPSREHVLVRGDAGNRGARAAARPATGRDAVHDRDGGVPGPFVPLHRADGHQRRHSHRRPHAPESWTGLIGFFVNTLVIRTDLSGRPSFAEVVRRVREACLGAYAHQDLPFERLVEELGVERDQSRSPLFQVLLTVQDEGDQQVELAGLTLEPVETEHRVAKFDLSISLFEGPAGLSGAVEYNRDLFDAATVERLTAGFERILQTVGEDPELPVSDIELLSPRDRERVLVEWNAARREESGEDACIPALFEAQVRAAPDAVAVVCGEEVLRYRELNERANRLAHHLRKRGVKAETVVGLSVERSVESVVGMLGILKAGGAYLPLDPVYPGARLAFMARDAVVGLVVTQASVAAATGEALEGIARVCVDGAEAATIADERADNPPAEAAPESLAYVIYTSGTSGQPKGAAVEHRGVSNLVRTQREALGVGPGTRMLQFASTSFDASVWETFLALCTGAALHIAAP